MQVKIRGLRIELGEIESKIEQISGVSAAVVNKVSLENKEALKNTTIFTTTVMFDTEKIDKAMLKMPNMRSEDTALWWRILREGYTAYGLNENLVLYRRPAVSLSSNKIVKYDKLYNIIFMNFQWGP